MRKGIHKGNRLHEAGMLERNRRGGGGKWGNIGYNSGRFGN